MEPHFVVTHIIFYSALNPGNLTLVECDDGSIRILRNERPVPGCVWESHQLEPAVQRFRALVAQLGGAPN